MLGRLSKRSSEGWVLSAGAALHTYQQTSAQAAPEGERGSQQQLPGQQGRLNPFPTAAKRLLKSPEAAGERNPP